MNETFSITEQLIATWQSLVETVVQATPRVIAGIILVIVAFIVAKVIERVLRSILVRLKLDALVGRIGLDKTLQRLGLTQPPSHLLPRIAYFLLLFLFAQSLAQALGMAAISNALGSFLAYLPNLIAALLLVIVGSLAGQFAGAAATRAAKEAGIEFANTIGTLASVLILFVSGIMALTQLQIHTEIITMVTICGLAGLALAFGLSFGLGTREITRNVVAGFYVRKLFRAGEPLEVAGESGVLKAITPTQTVLDKDGRIVTVANAVLMDQVVRQ